MSKKKDIFLDIEAFKQGFYALEDTTKAPVGSARVMKNCQVTDRGGISPRPGVALFGNANTSNFGTKGFYNFRRSFGQDEILIKNYDTKREIYSKNRATAGWNIMKKDYVSDKDWGYLASLVNSDNQDYVIGGNQYDNYERWNGSIAQVSADVAAGATSIPVDSVLTSETYETQTATTSSATTVGVGTTPWANSQWVGMYVFFPGTNLISKISANTNNTLTFDAIVDPGLVPFQVRKLTFPPTGSLLVNGISVTYTQLLSAISIPVPASPAIAAITKNTLVFSEPTYYPSNPKGNRFTNFLGRIIVGRVRSAQARDSGGALQGYAAAGSAFVSKVNIPVDFSFSGNRVAGEGDIISTPYGGGDINDVMAQEDSFYIFKDQYIEADKYSQDSADIAIRVPLKPGTGSIGRVIRGSDDIYFITLDNKFTSIGRVKQTGTSVSTAQNVVPQTDNIGYPIKRLLDTYDFHDINGAEYKDKLYINSKSSSTILKNDKIIVYNKINKAFDGLWDLGAYGFQLFNNGTQFLMADSTTPNIYQMFVGHADVLGKTRFPIAAQYASHFMNLTPSKANLQGLHAVYFEGYINSVSTITFKIWKDFADDPFLQFDFKGTEGSLLDGQELVAFLGGNPVSLFPMGTVDSTPDSEGRRHFQFRVYFPFQYGNFFSVGFESAGLEYNWEITRYGMSLAEDISVGTSRIKSI